MTKLFGVSPSHKKSHHDLPNETTEHHTSHAHHGESHGHEEGDHDDHHAPAVHHEHHITVDLHDDHHEEDIGQIALDVLELADEIVIIAPIAGVDPALIDISLSRNILTLSGERQPAKIYLDAKRTLVEECYYGTFSRSVILPENLAFNKIRATVEHNIIFVHVPKLTFISKTIKINDE